MIKRYIRSNILPIVIAVLMAILTAVLVILSVLSQPYGNEATCEGQYVGTYTADDGVGTRVIELSQRDGSYGIEMTDAVESPDNNLYQYDVLVSEDFTFSDQDSASVHMISKVQGYDYLMNVYYMGDHLLVSLNDNYTEYGNEIVLDRTCITHHTSYETAQTVVIICLIIAALVLAAAIARRKKLFGAVIMLVVSAIGIIWIMRNVYTPNYQGTYSFDLSDIENEDEETLGGVKALNMYIHQKNNGDYIYVIKCVYDNTANKIVSSDSTTPSEIIMTFAYKVAKGKITQRLTGSQLAIIWSYVEGQEIKSLDIIRTDTGAVAVANGAGVKNEHITYTLNKEEKLLLYQQLPIAMLIVPTIYIGICIALLLRKRKEIRSRDPFASVYNEYIIKDITYICPEYQSMKNYFIQNVLGGRVRIMRDYFAVNDSGLANPLYTKAAATEYESALGVKRCSAYEVVGGEDVDYVLLLHNKKMELAVRQTGNLVYIYSLEVVHDEK